MGSKGGGGFDTGGLELATKEATALQREIYEQTLADVQPWYEMGVGGVDILSDLLGIPGGSVQSQQSIYDQLLPQYTTPGAAPAGPEQQLYTDSAGNITTEKFANYDTLTKNPIYGDVIGGAAAPQDVTDFEGLNAAVQAQLAGQGTPEDYGSLLQTFGMEQFEEDPGAQYRREQAQQALERSMAAQGVTLGGGGYGNINPQVARALEEQSQGIASQEYNAAFDRYNIGQQNVFNRLMGVAGMGQGATGQMSAAGQAYGTNVGNLTTGLAGAQANMAAAQASQPSMFGQLLGAGAQFAGATYGGGGWTF